MGAALGDLAIGEEQDGVGVHEGAQPVRDDEGDPILGIAADSGADAMFGAGVDGGG